MKQLSNINEWLYTNLDLIEECSEKNIKPVVLVGGASSSGKSYTSKLLKEFLERHNLRSVVISTDSYNKGIAQNIFDIVDKQYYGGSLTNKEQVVSNIKNIIINTDFDQKFNSDNLLAIYNSCNGLLNVDMKEFLTRLKYEFEHINFDQKDIYDLNLVSQDIESLKQNKTILSKNYSKRISERVVTDTPLDGKQIDVIIIEGIYALDKIITDKLDKQSIIKNFVDCNNKNLFLRRMIRDLSITNCSKSFILSNYLEFVAPEYIKTVLPYKDTADIVLKNDMTFEELRSGEKSSQQKYQISHEVADKLFKNAKLIEKSYQQDIYFGSSKDDNILKLRLQGKTKDSLVMTSLTYKGKPKARQDEKLIRPVQKFADAQELASLFKDKNDLINKFGKSGISPFKTINKIRYTLDLNGDQIKIDYIKDKIYVEIDSIKNIKLYNYLNKSPKAKEIIKEI